jgi:hypothetical protein
LRLLDRLTLQNNPDEAAIRPPHEDRLSGLQPRLRQLKSHRNRRRQFVGDDLMNKSALGRLLQLLYLLYLLNVV